MRGTIPCLGILLALFSPVFAADGDWSPVDYSFACGNVSVSIKSTCAYRMSREHETECIEQTVHVVDPKTGEARQLEHDGRLVKDEALNADVLDAIVSHWACLKSTRRKHYILLWYFCKQGCDGPIKEWERIFDVNGKNISAALPRMGAAKERVALYGKLGLPTKKLSIPLHPIDY